MKEAVTRMPNSNVAAWQNREQGDPNPKADRPAVFIDVVGEFHDSFLPPFDASCKCP